MNKKTMERTIQKKKFTAVLNWKIAYRRQRQAYETRPTLTRSYNQTIYLHHAQYFPRRRVHALPDDLKTSLPQKREPFCSYVPNSTGKLSRVQRVLSSWSRFAQSVFLSCGGCSRHLVIAAYWVILAQSPAPLALSAAVTRTRCFYNSWPGEASTRLSWYFYRRFFEQVGLASTLHSLNYYRHIKL